MLLRVKSTLYILDLNQLLDIGFKTFPPLRGLPCYSADRALCCSTAFNFREVRSVCFSLLACAFGAAHEKSLPGQHREALPRVSSQERCGLSQEFKETPSGAHAFLHVAPWESASPPGASVAPLAAGPGPGGEGPSRGVGELALCLLWARHSRHHEEPSVSPPPPHAPVSEARSDLPGCCCWGHRPRARCCAHEASLPCRLGLRAGEGRARDRYCGSGDPRRGRPVLG